MNETKKVGPWSQAAITFFIVSGGAYGLETAVGAIGTFWTVILILTIPLLWAMPTALLVAELSSAIPESGGYYIWVRRGLGRFWAFQEGWWTINYSIVDLAIYPVLFVTYLSYFFPQLNETTSHVQIIRWIICIVFILINVLNNLFGSILIGTQSLIKFFLVSFPFVLLIALGLFRGDWSNLTKAFNPSLQKINASQLASGLAILLWNYCGWDNVSTYADEVKDPHKTFPKSLFIAMTVIIFSYLIPVIIGYKGSIDLKVWSDTSGWPEIAKILVGPWLGFLTAVAALISAWALFNAQLLYISRLPSAMANDGFLPKILTKKNKYNVPVYSLVIAGGAAALFSRWSLGKLMVVDILLYTLGISLEFVALVVLRNKEPNLVRPYKIPFNRLGLIIMSIFPILLGLIVAISSYEGANSVLQLKVVAASVLSGLIIYAIKLKT